MEQAQSNPFEKYIHSLSLMDKVIALKDAVEPEGGWPLRDIRLYTGKMMKSAAVHSVHAAWDELFEYIHANFLIPETASGPDETFSYRTRHPEMDEVRRFIDSTFRAPSKELEDLIRSIPPKIIEVVWPVSVARFLLRDCNLPINHRWLSTFGEFHRRYGNMVLGC